MSTNATAARIYEYGEPDAFRFETMDVPDPVGHLRQIHEPTKQLIQELLKNLVDWTRRMSPAPDSTSASSTATAWHPLSRGAPA
jgi:hypothetical protein